MLFVDAVCCACCLLFVVSRLLWLFVLLCLDICCGSLLFVVCYHFLLMCRVLCVVVLVLFVVC